jgi:hypothetical protein
VSDRIDFSAVVRDGEIRPEDSGALRYRLKWLNGKRVYVTVSESRPKRSDRQNRYLWACYKLVSDWSGYESEEIHELFKAMFLPTTEITLAGESRFITGSTASLNSKEFSEYVEKMRRWCAEQRLNIPSPEEWGVSS